MLRFNNVRLGSAFQIRKLIYILAAITISATPWLVVPQASAAAMVHLTGQVTDQNGQPLTDVTVALSAPGTSYIDMHPDAGLGRIYMSMGSEYSIYAPAGQYNVVFLARINDNLLPKVVPINIQTDTVLDEQLESGTLPTSTISGRITDSSGNPVSGLQVQANSISDDLNPLTTTDNNGNYSLSLKPQFYNLSLRCIAGASCGSFSYGMSPDNDYYVTGSNIVQNLVLPERTRTLSVTVLDSSGKPVTGQKVSATAATSGKETLSSGGDYSRYVVGADDSALTDSDGVALLHFFNNTTVAQKYLGTTYSNGDPAQNVSDEIALNDQDGAYTLWDDVTPPSVGTFQWSSNPLQLGQTTTLSIPITDNLSGIGHVDYYVSDGEGGSMSLVDGKWVATMGGRIQQSGTYSVSVLAYDKMGNRTDFISDNLIAYDGSNPAGPSSLTINSPTQNPNLSWDEIPGATAYNVYRDRAKIAASTTNSYYDSAAGEGSHTYYVTATTANGETNPSNQVTVLVDRTAPTTGTLSWSNNPISITQTATATIPVSDNLSGAAGGEYYLGDTDPGRGNATPMTLSNGNLVANFSNLTAGIYTVNVRVKDNAGNWSPVITDYLVVYNPVAAGVSGHSNTINPVYGADLLPGLVQSNQADQASFALSVKYDNSGNIASSSKLKFSYSTGANCSKASQAVNCHNLTLDSSSIQWLVVNGANGSQGTIQGIASLTIDGVTTTNPFRLVGVDGALLSPQNNDHITIDIFAPGENPNTATPLYHINDPITKGSLKIV